MVVTGLCGNIVLGEADGKLMPIWALGNSTQGLTISLSVVQASLCMCDGQFTAKVYVHRVVGGSLLNKLDRLAIVLSPYR